MDLNRRMKEYAHGSIMLFSIYTINRSVVESNILRIFCELFPIAKGKEYFQGDKRRMINIITGTVMSLNDCLGDDIISNEELGEKIEKSIIRNQKLGITQNKNIILFPPV